MLYGFEIMITLYNVEKYTSSHDGAGKHKIKIGRLRSFYQ